MVARALTMPGMAREASAAGVSVPQTDAPTTRTIARGDFKVDVLRGGIVVMRGEMRGVKATSATTSGQAGLHIELRLEGSSQSRELCPDGREFSLSKGQVHILGKPDAGSWRVQVPAQDRMTIVSFLFPPAVIETMAGAAPDFGECLDDVIRRRLNFAQSLSPSLRGLALECLSPATTGAASALHLESIALRVLVEACRIVGLTPSKNGREGDLLDQTEEFLLREAPRCWTIAEVADALGVSSARLSAAIRVASGRSAGAFLAAHRMKAAERLLTGPLSIAEIAATVGYASPEAFAKAFRRHAGRSPSAFRTDN